MNEKMENFSAVNFICWQLNNAFDSYVGPHPPPPFSPPSHTSQGIMILATDKLHKLAKNLHKLAYLAVRALDPLCKWRLILGMFFC